MKILFHFTITLFVLSLVACNQTKSPEPVKQYTFIGGKEGDKMDTTSFDSLQLSDPFILADEGNTDVLSGWKWRPVYGKARI